MLITDNIKAQLYGDRVSVVTADFLSTEHDPEVLRQIRSTEVDPCDNNSFPDCSESEVDHGYNGTESDDEAENVWDENEIDLKSDAEIRSQMMVAATIIGMALGFFGVLWY